MPALGVLHRALMLCRNSRRRFFVLARRHPAAFRLSIGDARRNLRPILARRGQIVQSGYTCPTKPSFPLASTANLSRGSFRPARGRFANICKCQTASPAAQSLQYQGVPIVAPYSLYGEPSGSPVISRVARRLTPSDICKTFARPLQPLQNRLSARGAVQCIRRLWAIWESPLHDGCIIAAPDHCYSHTRNGGKHHG